MRYLLEVAEPYLVRAFDGRASAANLNWITKLVAVVGAAEGAPRRRTAAKPAAGELILPTTSLSSAEHLARPFAASMRYLKRLVPFFRLQPFIIRLAIIVAWRANRQLPAAGSSSIELVAMTSFATAAS